METNVPKTARRALNTSGMRVTNQRALIMEIIRQGEEHLDAYDIYRQAHESEPRLSLSTVYRALQKFKELGLVDEVHFDEAHHHYETRQSTEHHHLKCLNCGKVVEFHYPLSRYIKRNVAEAKDFDITEAEVRLTGYCSQCRQGQK